MILGERIIFFIRNWEKNSKKGKIKEVKKASLSKWIFFQNMFMVFVLQCMLL